MKIMSPTYKQKRQAFLLILLILVLTVLMLPWLLTGVINSDSIRSRISDEIFVKSGIAITTRKIYVDLFPKPSLQVNDIQIETGSSSVISIKSAHVFLNLFSLLHGKFKTNEILFKNGRILSESNPDDIPGPSIAVPMVLAGLESRLDDIFSYFSKNQKEIILKFEHFEYDYFKDINAVINFSRTSPRITAQIFIKDPLFEREKLASMVPLDQVNINSIRADGIRMDFLLNDNGIADGRFFIQSPQIVSDLSKKPVLTSALLEGAFSISDNTVTIHLLPSVLSYPEGRIAIDFSLSKDHSSILFSGDNINITEGREACLELIPDIIVCKELFRILRGGTAGHISVSFNGTSLQDLFDEHRLVLAGSVTGGIAQIPVTELIVRDIDAEASVKDGVLYIEPEAGSVDNSSIQSGKLSVDLLNFSDHPFNGFFELDVNLDTLPRTLIFLLPGSRLSKELKLIKSIQGKARVDLTLNLGTKQDQVDVKVVADSISGSGYYKRIPGQIIINQSGFEYHNDISRIKNFTGTIHSQELQDINSTITLKDTPHILIESGSAVVDLTILLPWILEYDKVREIVSPVSGGTGSISFDGIRVDGPLLNTDAWEYNISGNGNNLNLDMGHHFNAVSNASASFHFSDISYEIDQLNTVINQTDFYSSTSHTGLIHNITTPFRISNGRFISGHDVSEFAGNIFFDANIHASLKTRRVSEKESHDILQFTLEDMPLTDISVRRDQDQTPFSFSGKINSKTLRKIIRHDSVLHQNIFKYTKGNDFEIESGYRDQIKITTPSIDISDIFNGSTSPDFSWEHIKGKTILLNADTLNVKKLNFKNFKSRILESNNQTVIHITNADLCSLLVKGTFNLGQKEVTTDLKFSESINGELGNTFSCFFNQPDLINGPFTLTGNIRSKGNISDFYKTFQGNVAFRATEGRIYRWTLFSRILSFLNVSKYFKGNLPDFSQKGFAYHQISVDAEIKDSKIFFDSAIIDGHDMTLIFSGWIDPLENQMDLTCLVAPFKTVDTIIRTIPVISTLLNGRLISVPVKAKGKIEDPVIIPLHPSSVGEGLVKMMVNILKTPVTLFEEKP